MIPDSQLRPDERASLLLHHLLNQSLSGLDFCILWQELSEQHSELEEVNQLVTRFLEGPDLAALDRALALLPEPTPEGRASLLPELQAQVSWQQDWSVASTRVRETSRVEFRCKTCDWSVTLAQEHAPNTEMRLPFDDITCPICEEPDQGQAGA